MSYEPFPQTDTTLPQPAQEAVYPAPTSIEAIKNFANNALGAAAIGGEVVLDKNDKVVKTRDEMLFESYPEDDLPSHGDFDFSLMFTKTDEEYDTRLAEINNKHKDLNIDPATLGAEQKRADFVKRGKVTEQSVQDARPNFRHIQTDPEIRDAFQEYRNAHPNLNEDQLMKALREDPSLRLRVGVRLLQAAKAYQYAISGEDKKNPSYAGYSHLDGLTSKEYAALLTLSMVDGTFKKPGQGFQREYSRLMDVENGRHRQAAEAILYRPRDWQEWIDKRR